MLIEVIHESPRVKRYFSWFNVLMWDLVWFCSLLLFWSDCTSFWIILCPYFKCFFFSNTLLILDPILCLKTSLFRQTWPPPSVILYHDQAVPTRIEQSEQDIYLHLIYLISEWKIYKDVFNLALVLFYKQYLCFVLRFQVTSSKF